jgi:hypothetical protein
LKLIYHKENAPSNVSPFDEAVVQIAHNEHVNIACPYLGLNYLSRITLLCKSWRLLTDVEAWIQSQNVNQRASILDFIKMNLNSIRHFPKLHAKTIMNENSAIFGSANFTESGICHRTELSAYLNDDDSVNELNRWFNSQWNQAFEISLDKVQDFMSALPKENPNNSAIKVSISPEIPKMDSQLLLFDKKNISSTPIYDINEYNLRLIEKVNIFSDRNWLNSYLDLAESLISRLGIKSNDSRLAMSIPQKGYWILPISINNRYVLAPFFKKGRAMIGIIYGSEYAQMPNIQSSVIEDGKFSALSGEKEIDVPYFLKFQSAEEIIEDNVIYEGWLKAAEFELNRAQASSFRKFHSHEAFKLVMDHEYRQMIFEKAL